MNPFSFLKVEYEYSSSFLWPPSETLVSYPLHNFMSPFIEAYSTDVDILNESSRFTRVSL